MGESSHKQCAVRHSVFPSALYKAPPQCNLASQCRLNDHIFQEKDVQLSRISNPVVSHFMNQRLGLWFFPLTIAHALFFSIWIPERDALSQNISLKTHSSHGNKVFFFLLLQIQEAIWTSCFYFFSLLVLTLESNAHTFAEQLRNGYWNTEPRLWNPLRANESDNWLFFFSPPPFHFKFKSCMTKMIPIPF